MTKRAADRQISKDCYVDDEEDADHGAGTSTTDAGASDATNSNRASDEVLAQRRIVKVRRNDDRSWKGNTNSSSNPFAKAQLEVSAPPEPSSSTVATTTSPPANDGPEESNDNPRESQDAAPSSDRESNGPRDVEAVVSKDVMQSSPNGTDEAASNEKANESLPDEKVSSVESNKPDGLSSNDKVAQDVVPPVKATKNEPSDVPISIFGSTSGFSGFGSVASTSGFTGFSTNIPSGGNAFGFGSTGSTTGGFTSTGFSFGQSSTGLAATTTSSGPEEPAQDGETGESTEKEAAFHSATKQPLVALPTDYELVSGEEQEEVLLEMRCRTYRWGPLQRPASNPEPSAPSGSVALSVPPSTTSTFQETKGTSDSSGKGDANDSTFAWHEAGIGPLRILQHPTTHGLRLVQRRESTPNGPATKLLWNVPLYNESTARLLGDKHVQLSTILNQPTLILCKCGSVGQANELLRLVEDRVPHLKSACAKSSTNGTESSEAATEENTGKETLPVSTEEPLS